MPRWLCHGRSDQGHARWRCWRSRLSHCCALWPRAPRRRAVAARRRLPRPCRHRCRCPRPASPSAPASGGTVTNVWRATVDSSALPLGDGNVSSTPQVGYVASCTGSIAPRRRRPPRRRLDQLGSRHVEHDRQASRAGRGALAGCRLPGQRRRRHPHVQHRRSAGEPAGRRSFRSSASDPAWRPSTDTDPHAAARPRSRARPAPARRSRLCRHAVVRGAGPIGVLKKGSSCTTDSTRPGADAVANEDQDGCDGHPDAQRSTTTTSRSASGTPPTGSTLVGSFVDGYGIYVERDARGTCRRTPTSTPATVTPARSSGTARYHDIPLRRHD